MANAFLSRRAARLGAALWVTCGAFSAAAQAPVPRVAAVEVRSDDPAARREELSELVTVVPGEPLSERAVRQTLRNLQATGAAAEVALYTRPATAAEAGFDLAPGEPPPVVVVVVLWAAVQIAEVELVGDLGLARRDLERELLTAAGQPLVEEQLLRSVYRLQELYERRGYFQAQVRLAVRDVAPQRARVAFEIQSGPRARVGPVTFQGQLGTLDAAALARVLEAPAGTPYHAEDVQGDRDRLRQLLVRRGHRRAEVAPPREVRDATTGTVAVEWTLTAGPRIELEVLGAERKTLERQDLLPLLGDQGYDDALVAQSLDRIRRYYQEKGHWQAEVRTREEPAGPDALRLVLTIEPGPVLTLDELTFVGNQAVSSDKLAALMTTAPRQLLQLGSGRLVQAVLDEDLANLRSYYALQGYVGATVGPPRVEVEGSDLKLVVPVSEGNQRRRVDALELEGVESLEKGPLLAALEVKVGGPFHPVLLEESVALLQTAYQAAGFASAQVSAEERWDDAGTGVKLRLRVIEGPRTVVDRVIVRGNSVTRREVLTRTLDLAPGQPVSPARLLELERSLYRLGIFSFVDVSLAPGDETAERERDVIVRVREGKTRRVSYGPGYDSEDGVRGLISYSDSNLFGRAYTLRADLRYGDQERFARVLFDQPAVAGYAVPLTSSLRYEEQSRRSYDVVRRIASTQLEWPRGARRFSLGFDYREVDSTPTEDVIAPVIDRRDLDISISSVIASAAIDRRDNPIDPARGWYGSLRLQYSFSLGQLTDADLAKLYLQTSHYWPVGRRGGLFAASLRAGLIEPLAGKSTAPIDERFFAGGDYSHRAYDRDELGIPGSTLIDGLPTGGNGLLLVNLDYRFPLWGALSGVVFYDGGNVWARWQDFDPADLRSGLGLELSYRSPIGPVRLGSGYQLDPQIGTESRYHVYFAIGHPF